MKRIIAPVLALLAFCVAQADTVAPKGNFEWAVQSTAAAPVISLTPEVYQHVVFQSIDGKQIDINTATGKVTYTGMTPDEAARKFWDALTRVIVQANRTEHSNH